MSNSQYDPPALNELEVSVFGPGYGEAVLVHLGRRKWILVDSCIEPVSKLPASLKYLQEIDVNVDEAVRLIVATHWHDDHIRGISSLFNACQSAEIAISDALRVDEFLTLVELYRKPGMMISSGLDEFTRVFQILELHTPKGVRFNPPKHASVDRLLYRDQIELTDETVVEANVFALSPSDASILQARLSFAELLPKENEHPKRVASPTPNHTSVVLWVEVGNHKILLGADLERTIDPKTGWSVILDDSTVASGKADVFKIPHHGSENAHHEGVWSELLSGEPFVVVTPFRRSLLPSPADVERITRLTPHAYATAPTRHRRQRWRNRVVRDFVKQSTRSMQSVHHGWGHVRFRRKIDETNKPWHVDLFGDAYALNMS